MFCLFWSNWLDFHLLINFQFENIAPHFCYWILLFFIIYHLLNLETFPYVFESGIFFWVSEYDGNLLTIVFCFPWVGLSSWKVIKLTQRRLSSRAVESEKQAGMQWPSSLIVVFQNWFREAEKTRVIPRLGGYYCCCRGQNCLWGEYCALE